MRNTNRAGGSWKPQASSCRLARRSSPALRQSPPWQYAFGIARDPDTGAPRFGPPATHEKELIVKVPEPAPNEALLYMLTSEVNFNDIWALTGIPVSPFDATRKTCRSRVPGALRWSRRWGSETRAQGRVKVGDLVTVYSGTNDLLSPQVGNDPMYADFSIQGYETETGSHAQFLTVQAPQMHAIPPDLTWNKRVAMCSISARLRAVCSPPCRSRQARTLFVEGAATGTGLDALRSIGANRAAGDGAGLVAGTR
jgi:acrylyl-CoA reductase (NADPH) / 3-hydroxypropionyl-CoA dehydratase / 3-hydroxypropionyl-CoA synthetase